MTAGLLPTAACGGDDFDGDSVATGGAGVGGSTSNPSGSGGASAGSIGGTTGVPWSALPPQTVDPRFPYSVTTVDRPLGACEVEYQYEIQRFIVPLPPEGELASPEVLCAGVLEQPAESGWAARVTVEPTPTGHVGHVTVAESLRGSVVGLPTVRVVENHPAAAPTLGSVTAASDGYRFEMTFSGTSPEGRIVLETRFQVGCGQDAREVRALTALYECTGEWLSSGDECSDCATICEMAPAPIRPSGSDDRSALSEALRLGVRVLGRVHGALALLAEHGSGPGFAYDWSAEDGELLWTDGDVALWRPPPEHGSHVVQVTARGPRAAAVATLHWSQGA